MNKLHLEDKINDWIEKTVFVGDEVELIIRTKNLATKERQTLDITVDIK